MRAHDTVRAGRQRRSSAAGGPRALPARRWVRERDDLWNDGRGASLGAASRERMLAALRTAGIDLGREVVVGVAASSVEDALAQARQAATFSCRTLLLPPPFYFKGATDEGLLRWFAPVLERIAADGQRAILYHIPSVTEVPLSLALIGRLKKRFPATVQGVKDSSGEWGMHGRFSPSTPS